MLRSKAFSVVCALALCSLGACSYPDTVRDNSEIASTKFVKVEDSQFIIDGNPYRFVGVNFWYGAYLGSPTTTGDRDRLTGELDQLSQMGVTNLRVLAASELSPLSNSIRPAFQDKSGNYDENLLTGLDFLLTELAKRDMKAVLYLGNFWEWSGGMTVYMHWDEGRDLVPSNDQNVEFWPAYPNLASQFYSSESSNARFRKYVAHLIGRTNSITGDKYKDDPTIMSWQLANEPRPGAGGPDGEDQIAAMIEWIDSTARFIKKRAPNQLISIGNEGVIGCIDSEACVKQANKLDSIDYLTFHMWPKNWGWIDADDMEGTYPNARAQALQYIDQHLKFAEEAGKPIVLEEFGLERDGGAVKPTSSTQFRDGFLATVFETLEDDANSCGPFAGTNVWAWGGQGRAHHADAEWRNGDTNFVGDPPQEPQGLNSIFDRDESTIAVLQSHASRLTVATKECAETQ